MRLAVIEALLKPRITEDRFEYWTETLKKEIRKRAKRYGIDLLIPTVEEDLKEKYQEKLRSLRKKRKNVEMLITGYSYFIRELHP